MAVKPSEIVIADAVMQDWQSIVDVVARITGARVCLVMKQSGPDIKVLVASDTSANPYKAGDRELLAGSGLYCQKVIERQEMVLVPDARRSKEWMNNPDLRHNLVSYLGFPIRWPDGTIFGTFCVLDDKGNEHSPAMIDLVGRMRDLIEGHLKLQHALWVEQRLQQQSFARRVLDKIPMAIGCARLDSEGAILYLNEHFVHQFGYTLAEVPTFEAWVAATNPTPLKQGIPFVEWRRLMRGTLKEGGLIEPVEFRFTCKDGRILDVLVHSARAGDMVVASFLDVTARNRAEGALRDSERRHRLLAENVVDVLWTFDLVQGLTYVGPAIENLTGHTPDHYLRLSIEEMFAPESHAEVRAILEQARTALKEGGSFRLMPRELLAQRKDGSTVWVELTASGVVGDGQRLELAGITRDISERVRNEEHKQRILSMVNASQLGLMQEFNASVAHELNQPLGAILRNAEAAAALLEGDHPDLAELRAIVTDIRRDDQRAAAIIGRIRDVMGKRGLKLGSLSLRGEVEDCVDMVRHELAAKQIALAVEIPPDLPQVAADRIQLQQVLLNLVKNAMDALAGQPEARRRIAIAARSLPEGMVELTVCDSGEGIRPEDINKLFEYYYTTRPEGLGMGLPLSRMIFKGHGGHIHVASTPGQRTEVSITLKQADTHRTP